MQFKHNKHVIFFYLIGDSSFSSKVVIFFLSLPKVFQGDQTVSSREQKKIHGENPEIEEMCFLILLRE